MKPNCNQHSIGQDGTGHIRWISAHRWIADQFEVAVRHRVRLFCEPRRPRPTKAASASAASRPSRFAALVSALLLSGLMFPVSGFASLLTVSLTNAVTGGPETNYVAVIPLNDNNPVLADGTIVTKGYATRAYPDTNGLLTLYRGPGFYALTNRSIAVVYRFNDLSSNATATIQSGWNTYGPSIVTIDTTTNSLPLTAWHDFTNTATSVTLSDYLLTSAYNGGWGAFGTNILSSGAFPFNLQSATGYPWNALVGKPDVVTNNRPNVTLGGLNLVGNQIAPSPQFTDTKIYGDSNLTSSIQGDGSGGFGVFTRGATNTFQVSGNLQVDGSVSGDGNGWTNLNAAQLTGTMPLDKLPAVVPTNRYASSITPLMFGAVGDGVTDDTAAFQRMAVFWSTNATMLPIDLLSKSYAINSGTIVFSNRTDTYQAGSLNMFNGIVFSTNQNLNPVFVVASDFPRVHEFSLYGPGTNSYLGTNVGMFVGRWPGGGYIQDPILEHVRIENFSTNLVGDYWVQGKIENCNIISPGKVSVLIRGDETVIKNSTIGEAGPAHYGIDYGPQNAPDVKSNAIGLKVFGGLNVTVANCDMNDIGMALWARCGRIEVSHVNCEIGWDYSQPMLYFTNCNVIDINNCGASSPFSGSGDFKDALRIDSSDGNCAITMFGNSFYGTNVFNGCFPSFIAGIVGTVVPCKFNGTYVPVSASFYQGLLLQNTVNGVIALGVDAAGGLNGDASKKYPSYFAYGGQTYIKMPTGSFKIVGVNNSGQVEIDNYGNVFATTGSFYNRASGANYNIGPNDEGNFTWNTNGYIYCKTNLTAKRFASTNSVPAAVTIGASPFNFTNTTTVNLECYFSGGTAYSVSKNGVAVYGSLAGNAYFALQPGAFTTITYTVSPTLYTNSW